MNLRKHLPPTFPNIICLCGSTKFQTVFERENKRLTHEGYIVLSVGSFGHMDKMDMSSALKMYLDNLHKRKIDLSDWIFVLNVGNYIGDSTKGEIIYANKTGKPVVYLQPLLKKEQ